MASRIIENSAQLKIFWANGTRQWQNVYGMLGSPTMVPNITQALVDALFTAIKARAETTTILGMMPTTTQLVACSVRDLRNEAMAEIKSAGTPAAGTGTGDLLPLNNAVCVTIRTAKAGKSFRGRSYIAGWNEAQNDGTGRMNQTTADAAKGFITGIGQAFGAPFQAQLAVLSFARDAETIPAKVITGKSSFSNGVTLLESRNLKWESQRRRTGRT